LLARKLVEQDKVDFIIGPLSGSEGIAMRDFAKAIPDTVAIKAFPGDDMGRSRTELLSLQPRRLAMGASASAITS
jgi:hypothetical protein